MAKEVDVEEEDADMQALEEAQREWEGVTEGVAVPGEGARV